VSGSDAAAPGRRIAGSALITSATVIATMALGAVLAVLIVLQFGKTPRTDGLLAAYGVYGLLLTLAQSARASVAARLVEGSSVFANLDRFLAGALVMALAAAVPLVLLGQPVAELLTGDLPAEAASTARTALAILWVAAAAHLAAALGAAALGTRGQFALPGLAYVMGGVLAIGLMLALAGPLGIDAVAVGVAAGSVVTAATIGSRLARAGYRPDLRKLFPGRAATVAAGVVVVGSVGYTISQATYVVSVAFAATLEPGAVTLYSYAFFAAALVLGASAGTAGIVLAAPVARDWDRRAETLLGHLETVTRGGLLLVLPSLGVMAVAGDELVELVLGSELAAEDPDTVAHTFLGLGGMMVCGAALSVPMLAALARARFGAIAWTAALTVVAHMPLSALAASLGSTEWIAGAASMSAAISLAAMLVFVFGRSTGAALAVVLRELALMGAAAALSFAAAGLLGASLGGGAADVAGASLGVAVFALALRVAEPEAWRLAVRMSAPLRARG
jgi:peptidoglycan biosynthesis protein MviN/MurJ (putative lipid II flippase)